MDCGALRLFMWCTIRLKLQMQSRWTHEMKPCGTHTEHCLETSVKEAAKLTVILCVEQSLVELTNKHTCYL